MLNNTNRFKRLRNILSMRAGVPNPDEQAAELLRHQPIQYKPTSHGSRPKPKRPMPHQKPGRKPRIY